MDFSGLLWTSVDDGLWTEVDISGEWTWTEVDFSGQKSEDTCPPQAFSRKNLSCLQSYPLAPKVLAESGKAADHDERAQYCTICGPDFCSMLISKEL